MSKKMSKFIACIIMSLSILMLDAKLAVSAATPTKAEYTMKKDSVTYKDKKGNTKGIVYFQYPFIKGDTEASKKINDVLKAESKAYMQSDSAISLKDNTEAAIENNAMASDVTYYYKAICKVTYNDNSIMSLHMKNCWFAGGVYNQTDYGYTFNLKSGEKLGISDVVSGDVKSIKNKILETGKKYLTTDGILDQKAYDIIKSYKLEDYKFYLSKGKVYICFGSYELEHGTGWDIFSIKSKY